MMKQIVSTTAVIFTALMANAAIACDTCLVHRVVPTETTTAVTQTSTTPVWPAVLVCVLGTALICGVVYGLRKIAARSES